MIQRSHPTLLEKSLLVSEGLPGLKEAGKEYAPMNSANGGKGRKGKRVCGFGFLLLFIY